MTRRALLLAALLAAGGAIASPPAAVAQVGHPIHHHQAVPMAPAGVVAPMAMPMPMPTGAMPARSPYLGTFRPDPTLMMTTGAGTSHGYVPAGNPSHVATMGLYGPFSRLRSVPEEVITYSRGYDGVLRPATSGIQYNYPDPRAYPDTELVPTRYMVGPYEGVTRRSRMGAYLLGQQ